MEGKGRPRRSGRSTSPDPCAQDGKAGAGRSGSRTERPGVLSGSFLQEIHIPRWLISTTLP